MSSDGDWDWDAAASDGVEGTLHLKYLSVTDVTPSFCSRHVGFALGKVKASDGVPWWRVINSSGRISFRPKDRYATESSER